MTAPKPLFLYEQIMLLALHNEKGTVATGFLEYAVAGAVLAELLLDRRVSIDDNRKQLVDLHNTEPTGDPIIDATHAARTLSALRTFFRHLERAVPQIADEEPHGGACLPWNQFDAARLGGLQPVEQFPGGYIDGIHDTDPASHCRHRTSP
jgi:hypothetical protein